MNYQTEIDFALKVLQDAEDNGFDETKMWEMMQHDIDYMRLFLPQPSVLVEITRHIKLIIKAIEHNKIFAEMMQQVFKIDEALEQGLTQEVKAALRRHAVLSKKLDPSFFSYKYHSGSSLQDGIQQLGICLGLLLNPTNNDDFNNQLHQSIEQFYKAKQN